jgi:glutathione peroxidase
MSRSVLRRFAAAPLAVLVSSALLGTPAAADADDVACPAYLNHDFRKLHASGTVNLCKAFAGKPLLIVNTASHCGYTPQFQALQALHERYRERGLVVVGFPSDSFRQEADDDAETAEICYVNYGVKFTMVATSPVTGTEANPVFRELARQAREPKWNFTKYLVAADGSVQQVFDSSVNPNSREFTAAIERLLQ